MAVVPARAQNLARSLSGGYHVPWQIAGKGAVRMRIFCGRLVNPGSVAQDRVVEISGRRIVSIGPRGDKKPAGEDIDLGNRTVIPGLIDVHCHGGMGDDFSLGRIDKAPAYLARRGTTSFLATNYPMEREVYINGLRGLKKKYHEPHFTGARMLGVHLEGPFLNPGHGAQSPGLCWPPTKENVDFLLAELGDALKMITIAPELPGAIDAIQCFEAKGIVTSAGHTEADRTHIQVAYEAGLRHVTHILNAMEVPAGPTRGVRGIGCAEFCLGSDDMTADVMADAGGRHLCTEWLKIVFRCLGPRRLALISDAMPIAGLPPGPYPTGDGRTIRLTAGQDVTFIDDVLLGGSVMMMMDTVKNLMSHLGLGLHEVIACGTSTPAKLLKIDGRKGSLGPGKDADLVALDDRMQVCLTMVEGKIAYQQASE